MKLNVKRDRSRAGQKDLEKSNVGHFDIPTHMLRVISQFVSQFVRAITHVSH